MSKALIPLLLVLGMIASTPVMAAKQGLYRWHDDDGTVQYSDYPPEGRDSEFIELTGAKKKLSDSQPAQAEADKPAEATDGKSKVYDQMEVLPKKDPVLCKQAQDNLKALESARIRITEPDGSKRFLSEDEKEVQRANAHKFIDIHC